MNGDGLSKEVCNEMNSYQVQKENIPAWVLKLMIWIISNMLYHTEDLRMVRK
ncbi:hypothetical protein [Flavobacterium cheongpyeongense]|uniref:hypothetical protein n=1 Tax=Flavobacterium cheongpyeongense TaxID=2212651 RepID=UPI001403B916|nr:hypothetical protein [Flavobacterium cheongpyeongense]